MFWDFEDEFWDQDPEDFALYGGWLGLIEAELEEEEELTKELEEEIDHEEDDFLE